jgi:hypothetical protein
MQTRRDMLKNSALGFGSLALTSMLQAENPLAAKRPHFRPRAKRVIFLFMKGGPAHMDTFEYKPLLQRDHGKPSRGMWMTSVSFMAPMAPTPPTAARY